MKQQELCDAAAVPLITLKAYRKKAGTPPSFERFRSAGFSHVVCHMNFAMFEEGYSLRCLLSTENSYLKPRHYACLFRYFLRAPIKPSNDAVNNPPVAGRGTTETRGTKLYSTEYAI